MGLLRGYDGRRGPKRLQRRVIEEVGQSVEAVTVEKRRASSSAIIRSHEALMAPR